MNRAVCRTIGKKILCALTLFPMLPQAAHAIPAITCHCFTDRSHDPARPGIADPYFLATTQNSFFAVVFGTDKKSIVIKKQQGALSEDLWIAHWIASKSGIAPERVFQTKAKSDSWKNTIAVLRISPKMLGPRFLNALNRHAPDIRLSEAVLDELFLKDHLVSEEELAGLRNAGATNQEVILAVLIAAKIRQPAGQIYRGVKSGTNTWGALLATSQIDTKNMQREVSGILKIRPLQPGVSSQQ